MAPNVMIDGIEYQPTETGDDIRIVILQRGFVMVGYYRRDGDNCRLVKAQNVRKWGTSRGLGELAAGGPKSETKLDPCGVVEFHRLTEIATLNCEASKWQQHL